MITKQLHEGWKLCDIRKQDWIPAQIPGDIYSALLDAGKMEDPFFGDNEYQAKALMEEDYEYRTVIHFDEKEFASCDEIMLHFDGIDTVADIYLNNCHLGKVKNMHRIWEFPVSELLTPGENLLRVVIHSPLKFMAEAFEKYKNIGNDDTIEGFMHLRKAHYMSGWDWGACLPNGGIFRPVSLLGIEKSRLDNVYIYQVHENGKVKLCPEVEDEIYTDDDVETTYDVAVTAPDGTRTVYEDCPVEIEIENPQLWWPNGIGEQALYQVEVILRNGDQVLDVWSRRIGLRTLTMHREKDEWGESFAHEVNGHTVFAMGADYIPEDNMTQRTSRERTRELLLQCKEANFNCVRVWGGGYYPEDWFYDICDELGLMVWQDFMFACAMYPGNQEFLDNVRLEAIDNVTRIRNHPSIALWCGNNENALAWRHGAPGGWGWKNAFSKEEQDTVFKAYYTVFHEILPEVVNDYTDGDDYWPSSPMAGPEPDQHGLDGTTSGDQHYWGVWHGFRPLESFDEVTTRFCSEYGFQSFPEMSTIETYALPEDYDIESEVMKSHQRSYIGNGRILDYMKMYYRVPDEFEQFIYMTHVLQGLSTKMGIEAHRRNMPYCMGSLIWQINDCWPVASWSTTDYYHKWKAAHYVMQDCFKEVIVASKWEGDTLAIYAVSDRLEEIQGELIIEVLDFQGNSVSLVEKEVNVAANTSTVLWKLNRESLLGGGSEKEMMLVVCLRQGDRVLDEKNAYFVYHKNLNLPEPHFSIQAGEENGEKFIQVSSDKLACNVMFYIPGESIFFSDNYIDIIPGRSYKIKVDTDLSPTQIQERIGVRYVR